MRISFGSDGFRAAIGAQFNLHSVVRILLGVAARLREQGGAGAAIPVGYDTRFMARQFAGLAAQTLKLAGFQPLLARQPVSSPYLAFAARELNAPIGVQITASHNPYYYCGVKLKGPHGGSIYAAEAALIEAAIAAVPLTEVNAVLAAADWPGDGAAFGVLDDSLQTAYAAAIATATAPGGPRRRLIVDCMNGTAALQYLPLLRERHNVRSALREEPDPLFGGGRPEPLPEFLGALIRAVKADGEAIGLAFDGDGDRLAVVAEDGRLLGTHEIYALLLEHLVALRAPPAAERADSAAWPQYAVASVSFSSLVAAAAERHGLLLLEVPIGFKHICETMRDFDCLIGGEESGGTALGHYLPERDALLMALLLLEAVSASGGSLAELLDSLHERYGPRHYKRRDVALAASADRDALKSRIRELSAQARLGGDAVVSLNHLDGMKIRTARGWVLVRLSGTEPLLRLYAEAESAAVAGVYIDAVLNRLDVS